ncbi:MBL fold metallo-hydrolase [Pseudonocardia hispaniensis]|uniref:MBL fold metallo-hydrolase n=1 Tax=Pseudonocardia hispaniensis TaxID=904933 RepID=A0ABW1IWK7_9PSEU
MSTLRPSALPARPLLLTSALVGAAATLVSAARGLPLALGATSAQLRAGAAGATPGAGGTYRNTEPSTWLSPRTALPVLVSLARRGSTGRPSLPVPLAPPTYPAAAGTLALTWFGHSSVLVEIDGRRVLADPVWGERVSPSPLIGPRRLHPVPAPLSELPPVDAVLISHDHYDHLDLPTVRALTQSGRAPFVVPLRVGAHLRRWGVPAERIIELDWGGRTQVAGLSITCAEARHFSGRGLRRDVTLWSSWAVAGATRNVYICGDTGYTAAFARAGRHLGPFDLALLPIGAYNERWPDVHLTPEEAVRAHRDLRAAMLIPMHWATFNLGFHPWAEPVERLLRAAAGDGVRLAVPRPGERVDLTAPPPLRDWWSAAA